MNCKLLFALVFITLFQTQCIAQNNINTNNGIKRPKLIVGLVVDQMRWDYLYRYQSRYGKAGFNRLLNKGYAYQNTMIPYTPTVTAAGHACIYSGSIPAINGIVGNDWIEQSTGSYMYCTQDKTVQTVGSKSPQGQMSPRNMFTTTIGDELRLATNFKSRVFGVALKDRGAILPAGHSANAAYWYDDSTGNFITSTYYMPSLPAWVNNFNALPLADEYVKNGWTTLYNQQTYTESVINNAPYARAGNKENNAVFPHGFSTNNKKNYIGLRTSPFGNTITFAFANALLVNERLGKSGQTDMLCISLSSTDYIGHRYGPQSPEVEDTYLRLDKDIEDFLQKLDTEIGVNNYVVFLSADHGAPQSPDFMNQQHLPGGSVQGQKLKAELNTAMQQKFGVKNLIKAYVEYQFYIDKKVLDSAKLTLQIVTDYAVQILLTKPDIVTACSYSNFSNLLLNDFQKQKLLNGYFFKRSGDIQIIGKAQYLDGFTNGTDHGVGYAYDAHIPLLWYGAGIPHGVNYTATYMTDIAPTIAAMLHIQMPNGTVGKPLVEVLR